MQTDGIDDLSFILVTLIVLPIVILVAQAAAYCQSKVSQGFCLLSVDQLTATWNKQTRGTFE